VDLEPAEIRVLGCLLEKQRTTPDAYPLSLNALRAACNQATNRDPVVDYDEATVRDALHRLGRRRYTRLASGAGSRAPKYRHLLDETLPMGRDEQAIICVLMLRGPQTPGELKQRADRMHAFGDLAAIGATLARLIDRRLVVRLERRPGQKEERYLELFGEDAQDGALALALAPASAAAPAEPLVRTPAVRDDAVAPPWSADPPPGRGPEPAVAELAARVGRLELALAALADERLAQLEREVAELRGALGG
jgi:uncharacterized protein YceH (UPF0502 family)